MNLKMFEGSNHVFLEDPDGKPENYQNLEYFSVGSEVLGTIGEWVKKVNRADLK